MTNCTIRWRPSGGRGEYEFVPSTALLNRSIYVQIDGFGVTIPSEVHGEMESGKPRLRKDEKGNRKVLHLVPLIMAIARLPEPAREDKKEMSWPLEDKGFIVSHLDVDIVEDDGARVIIKPLSIKILHANDKIIDLRSRLSQISSDYDVRRLEKIHANMPDLADAMAEHKMSILRGRNDMFIRLSASNAIKIQTDRLGMSNLVTITELEKLPATSLESDIVGSEGRILTRLHSYRERDRGIVSVAKNLFRARHGLLSCECCGIVPGFWYGSRADDCIQAHHRTPLEELLPDTLTTPEDLALLCPSCHAVIHAKRPWISVESLQENLRLIGHNFFC